MDTRLGLSLISAFAGMMSATALAEEGNQYAFGEINIPMATADEPILEKFSLEAATQYIENGAKAWTEGRKCVSCHTNGSYLLTRPSLSKTLGPPPQQMREFFVGQMKKLRAKEIEDLRGGLKPTEIAYIAAGLAEWDEHVTGEISEETQAALQLMFDVQSSDGSFSNEDCWPPLESSDYHGATVAALAAASAPGWIAQLDGPLREQFQKLVTYLKTTEPPHDYGRVLQLWVATAMPDLISPVHRKLEAQAMDNTCRCR